ncbi:MAG: hypothetical protein CEO12_192 [Parcubacteria group bacterium Gr01-1014_46]|nr:MAG: hypothetical protein CEO12_192 [Parcubacteria group bacterium Gr01-1014_46]
MINHKGSFYLGVFVFLIPFLGFPTMWKMGLVVFAGVTLVLTSIRIPTPRKIFRNKIKKETHTPEIEVVKIETPHVAKPEEHKEPIQIVEKDFKPISAPKKTKKVSVKVDSIRKSNVKDK